MRTTIWRLFLPCVALAMGCAHAADEPSDGDSGTPTDGGGKADSGGGKDGSPADSGWPDVEPGCKTAPPSNVCGLDPQCGCGTNTCEVNRVKLDGTTECVASGNNPVKTPCNDTTECAQGLTCLWGVCRPYCSQDGTDCGKASTTKCIQVQNSQSQPILNLLVCRLDCTLDDTGQSCGGNGRGCVYDGTNSATDCFDLSQYGTTTCSQNAPYCAAGYVCLSTYACARWCNINAPNCAGNTTCKPLQTPPMVNGKTYGVCLP
jgi:hypothetical protein